MPRPLPPGGAKVNLGVRVNPTGLARLDAAAAAAGLTRAEAVKAALADWVTAQERVHPPPRKEPA